MISLLLFLELRYSLICSKLQENITQDISEICKADISLENIEVKLKKKIQDKNKEFFVLVLSYSTDLFITEAIECLEDKLLFATKFHFNNVAEDFVLRVDVFRITFKTDVTILNSLLRKVKIYFNIKYSKSTENHLFISVCK